jgi:hypothetical protein
MAIATVGNVIKFETAGDATANTPIWVKGILFVQLTNTSQTFTIKDVTSSATKIFDARVYANTSKYIDYGDRGFRFENGLEFDAPAANGAMYVFLA